MSLLLRKRAIERAVAGELSPAQELRLRVHLAKCQGCQHHYNSLILVARALRGDPEPTRSEKDRALARLVLALEGPAPSSREERIEKVNGWRWIPALSLPATAVVLALLIPKSPLSRGQQVTPRGTETGIESKVGLLVYAKRKDLPPAGPVRLVAEFPGSGEAHVSRQDYVQFSVHHQLEESEYVAVVGVDQRGIVHTYVPQNQAEAVKVPPGRKGTTLGTSVDLSAAHQPGLLRLYAVLSLRPLDPREIERAAREAGKDIRGSQRLAIPSAKEQVTGLFSIDP